MGPQEPQWGPGTTIGPGDKGAQGSQGGLRIINWPWGPGTTMAFRDHNGMQGPQWGPRDHKGAQGLKWCLLTTMGHGDHNGGLLTIKEPGGNNVAQ